MKALKILESLGKNLGISLIIGLMLFIMCLNGVLTLTTICLVEFFVICLMIIVILCERPEVFLLSVWITLMTLAICYVLGRACDLGNIYAFPQDYKIFVEIFGGLAILLAALVGVVIISIINEIFFIGFNFSWKDPFITKSVKWIFRLGCGALICWAFWAFKTGI